MVLSNLHEWGPQFNTSVRLPKSAFLPNLLKSLEVSQIYITKSWTVKLPHFEFKSSEARRKDEDEFPKTSKESLEKLYNFLLYYTSCTQTNVEEIVSSSYWR